jgi:hypothetical protein
MDDSSNRAVARQLTVHYRFLLILAAPEFGQIITHTQEATKVLTLVERLKDRETRWSFACALALPD